MTPDTLGLVESRSIAAGVLLSDRMVKAAQVSLLKAKTICAGRYFIQIAGDRAAVETAVGVAENSDTPLAGSFIISRVHPALIESVGSCREILPGDALAVVECRTAVAGVMAADQALKKADVQLARLVTGQGISGKSFFVLNGEVAEVEEGVAAARQALGKKLIEAVILTAPDAAVIATVTLGKK
jgi:microcompartment protein CcmL/EutN